LLSVAVMQRLRLWDPVVLAYLIPGALVLGGFMALLATCRRLRWPGCRRSSAT
jgi:hypothetical protein